jgi:hypothetical protein
MSLATWGSNRDLAKLMGIVDYFLSMATDTF